MCWLACFWFPVNCSTFTRSGPDTFRGGCAETLTFHSDGSGNVTSFMSDQACGIPAMKICGGSDSQAVKPLTQVMGGPGSESAHGWRADPVQDHRTIDALRRMLHTDRPEELGEGRDVKEYKREYENLEFYCAWRVTNKTRRNIYEATRDDIRSQVATIRGQGLALKKLALILDGGEDLGFPLADDANEVFLLSGTKPELLVPILTQGLNENLGGGLFGSATYLAEDSAKIDQYTTPHTGLGQKGLGEMESIFFPGGEGHPGGGKKKAGRKKDLFYCMACRATLGWYQRTFDGKTNMDCKGKDVWVNKEKKELSEIPGSKPAMRYHSLVAQYGKKAKVKRFREFMFYNANQLNVEYIIAYHRV